MCLLVMIMLCESEGSKGRILGKTWGMPELTKTSPYVHSRVDSNTFTMGNPMPESNVPYGRVDFIPQSGTLELASVLEFLNNLWGPGTEKDRVAVPGCQCWNL
jgi:hypothetical protein